MHVFITLSVNPTYSESDWVATWEELLCSLNVELLSDFSLLNWKPKQNKKPKQG